MQTLNNVHEQFAHFFSGDNFRPFAMLLSKKLSEGHICLDLKELIGMPGFQRTYQTLEEISRDLAEEPLVGSSSDLVRPFILHRSKLYLHRYFSYESIILNKIWEFISVERENKERRMQLIQSERDFISGLFPYKEDLNALPEHEQIDWQKLAVLLAALNNFIIITGGPGTGKTFTVSKLLELLKRMNPDTKIGLAAPTGKAAMRLAETLKGHSVPGTIHRLLKTVYGSHHFKYNRNFPLELDVVIIDEASMIDAALFAKLLDAIRPETRLILLGDKDQLASVEAGSMFRDLCQSPEQTNSVSKQQADFLMSFMNEREAALFESYMGSGKDHILHDHIVELKRSRRFSSQLGIGKFSRAVILGDSDTVRTYLKPAGHSRLSDGQIKVDITYSEAIFRELVALYAAYIQEEDIQLALDKLNTIRILCAVREGEYGLYRCNARAEEVLKEMKLIDPTAEFYLNRPVMLTRNNYDLGLYNGDVGIVRPDKEGQMMVWFSDEGQLKAVQPARLEHIETVYAMTIHKSQGSEYDTALVILPQNEDSELLTRELLYTAVTRAKTSAVVQAGEESLIASVQKSVKRASGIHERLQSLSKEN
jgi:exodeoxyribonuclease V alpha subunit